MIVLHRKYRNDPFYYLDAFDGDNMRTYRRECHDNVWFLLSPAGRWEPDLPASGTVESLWVGDDRGPFTTEGFVQPEVDDEESPSVFSELGPFDPSTVQALDQSMMDTGPLHVPKRPWWKLW